MVHNECCVPPSQHIVCTRVVQMCCDVASNLRAERDRPPLVVWLVLRYYGRYNTCKMWVWCQLYRNLKNTRHMISKNLQNCRHNKAFAANAFHTSILGLSRIVLLYSLLFSSVIKCFVGSWTTVWEKSPFFEIPLLSNMYMKLIYCRSYIWQNWDNVEAPAKRIVFRLSIISLSENLVSGSS